MKKKIVEGMRIEGDTIYISPSFNLANDDWIRAARLQKKADQGDEEAKKKLAEMENTPMVEIEDDEDGI